MRARQHCQRELSNPALQPPLNVPVRAANRTHKLGKFMSLEVHGRSRRQTGARPPYTPPQSRRSHRVSESLSRRRPASRLSGSR